MPLSRRTLTTKQSSDDFQASLHAVYTPFQQVRDLLPLINRVKDARIVMLGEASHGTQEFYFWRRLLTQWLIVKHGFRFVAVEGDWPDAMSIHRYVTHHATSGSGGGHDARSVLSDFHRWPTWMWANTEIVRLMEWMRTHNAIQPEIRRAGFYGLDVYSLFESIDTVIGYLESNHPFLARRARSRYGCFDRFRRDGVSYARSLFRFPEGCEKEVLTMLQELLQSRLECPGGADEYFDLTQNARVIRNAEAYYRAMVHVDQNSWNVRDQHMMETLNLLLDRSGKDSKAIVWAHNTHIGDYRATDMVHDGMVNIGGLAREEYGAEQVALVGFTTYQGEVIASHAWDGPIQVMEVPRAKPGSLEARLHDVATERSSPHGNPQGYLIFEEGEENGPLGVTQEHRAIGVVYDPDHEKRGNYVPTRLPARYDAMIFLDRTTALEPLIVSSDQHDIPETWPSGQ